MKRSARDCLSVNVFTGTQDLELPSLLLPCWGRGHWKWRDSHATPMPRTLFSILIGMQLSPAFCEGWDSLCFSYWPLYSQLGQCQLPRLAHPGRKGEVDVCSSLPGQVTRPPLPAVPTGQGVSSTPSSQGQWTQPHTPLPLWVTVLPWVWSEEASRVLGSEF